MAHHLNSNSPTPAASPATQGGAGPHILVAGLQLFLLILLYSQTQSFGYAYFDDVDYVLENPMVRAGLSFDGLHWAFTSLYMSNWHPLTWLSHMLDVSLFGVDPGWAHLHNVALHGVVSYLVYLLLLRYCGSWGKACILSVVFLVHPLHVESVAWIAERKDLLCAIFFLLALLAYDSYRAHADKRYYAAALVSFVLALLAKPMAVTLPAVLLILDFFLYRQHFAASKSTGLLTGFNYMRALAEKLPFIALSAGSCVITIIAQDAGHAVAYLDAHSLSARWEVASRAYIVYLKQSLMPIDLVAFYPLDVTNSWTALLLPAVALCAALALALFYATGYPLIGAGLCWYLVTLLPVIGLVQVGSQAHADRYMYLPSVGLLMACIYLLPSRSSKHFKFAGLLLFIFLLYLSLICYWQVGYWKNQHVIFSRVLAVVGPNFPSHLHLAMDYKDRGMLPEARLQGEAAIASRPDRSEGYLIIANIALAEEKFAEAEKYYRATLSRQPEFAKGVAKVVNNLGISLALQGDIPAGIVMFRKALVINPNLTEAQQNLEIHLKKLPQQAAP